MVSNIVGDAIVVILSLALSGAAWMTVAIGTKRVYGSVKARGRSEFESTVAAVGCAIVLFLGGWLLLGLYWLAAWVLRGARSDHRASSHEGG